MSLYTKTILDLLGCTLEEAPLVEALMRDTYGTLDSLSLDIFKREAKRCLSEARKDPETARLSAQFRGKVQVRARDSGAPERGGVVNLDSSTIRVALRCLTDGPYRLHHDHVDMPVFRELRKRRFATMMLGIGGVTFALTDAGRTELEKTR